MSRGIWVALALAALLSGAARAAIPAAPKIAGAVAEANEGSGRAEPLLLEVTLRVAGDAPIAEGVLATHPTGLARLELRHSLGFVERHLLQGDSYGASRDGELLPRPHPFLPPVFLLQATSGAALEAALGSFGVSEREVVLGRLGDHDCYVFGGRIRGPVGAEQLLPSLWIDVASFEPVRIVRADGVEYRLGPTTLFDGIRVPTWIEIIEPGARPARLEVRGVAPASAPAAAFQVDWLTAPASAP